MRTLKPYPAYKESGVPWLGDVPSHWEMRRLKTLCSMKSGESITTMSIDPTGQYPVYGGNGLRGYTARYTHDGPHVLMGRQGALCGNIHIAHGRFWASEHAVVSTLYRDHVLEWFSEILTVMNLNQYSIAAAQPGLAVERILELWLPVPPLTEQTVIVRFLDHADRRIRRYIRAKEKLIALLEEQKQAIIHQAVTGRIDVRTGQPYPAYKSSGVEWLGNVPAHWNVKRLRQCGTTVGGMTPSMEERRYWDGDIPWVTPKDMKCEAIFDSGIRVTEAALRETSLRLIGPPAVLMVVRGMILARKVPIAWITNRVTINQDMKAVVPAVGIKAEFLARALDSAQDALATLIDEAGHGTRRLPTERWRALAVAVPSEHEQSLVVRFVDQATTKIDKGIADTRREVDLLREYRTRLIADVVTGKLDVREAAAELPEVDPLAEDDEEADPLDAAGEPAFHDDEAPAEVVG